MLKSPSKGASPDSKLVNTVNQNSQIGNAILNPARAGHMARLAPVFHGRNGSATVASIWIPPVRIDAGCFPLSVRSKKLSRLCAAFRYGFYSVCFFEKMVMV